MNLAVNLLIEMVAYLCECMTQLLCIHAFLGKKIKADVKMVAFVIAYVSILMLVINFELSEMWTFLADALIFAYIWHTFKLNISQGIIVIILDLLSVVSVQIIAVVPFHTLFETIENEYVVGLLINIITIALMYVFTHLIKLNNLYVRIIRWEKVVIRVLILCGILFMYLLIKFKINEKMLIFPYFISAIMACIVIMLVFNWQRDRYEVKRKRLQLYMHELYGNTFDGMVENIRRRQHDFKNQISAIYGMHLTAENFEELVETQKKYCDFLMKESRYDTILTKCNDKILAGFLYTKFTECEKKGMEVNFEISVNDIGNRLATYELIEIVGILLDNAVEYEVENKKGKELYFKLHDSEDALDIICRNKADYIPMDTITKFFKKGYSTKGENRGIGLYNVKKILSDNGEIIVTNKEIEESNWIEFKIHISKS